MAEGIIYFGEHAPKVPLFEDGRGIHIKELPEKLEAVGDLLKKEAARLEAERAYADPYLHLIDMTRGLAAMDDFLNAVDDNETKVQDAAKLHNGTRGDTIGEARDEIQNTAETHAQAHGEAMLTVCSVDRQLLEPALDTHPSASERQNEI
jgi:hypothetical protein